MQEKEFIGKGMFRCEVIRDQARCRRLLLENGIQELVSRVNHESIAGGALLGKDKGVVVGKPTRNGPELTAYVFVNQMTESEAIPIIRAMAYEIGNAVGVAPTMVVLDPEKNN